MEAILLIASLGLILLGAELFTNGVEWMGHRLDLAEGAVGSVLAAVGTAMPETMIPFVAIVMSARSGHPHEVGIGIGAILGAPFMLATLAMLVTGVAVLIRARGRQGDDRLQVEPLVIARDVRHFGGGLHACDRGRAAPGSARRRQGARGGRPARPVRDVRAGAPGGRAGRRCR